MNVGGRRARPPREGSTPGLRLSLGTMPQPIPPAVTSGAGLVCDFCGQRSSTIRRVALDQGYDRLQPASRELYACPPCSEAKETARKGLPPR
jgi:hypothetical protein